MFGTATNSEEPNPAASQPQPNKNTAQAGSRSTRTHFVVKEKKELQLLNPAAWTQSEQVMINAGSKKQRPPITFTEITKITFKKEQEWLLLRLLLN